MTWISSKIFDNVSVRKGRHEGKVFYSASFVLITIAQKPRRTVNSNSAMLRVKALLLWPELSVNQSVALIETYIVPFCAEIDRQTRGLCSQELMAHYPIDTDPQDISGV